MKTLTVLMFVTKLAVAASLIQFTPIDGTTNPSFQAVIGPDGLILQSVIISLDQNYTSVGLSIDGDIEGLVDCAPTCDFENLNIPLPAKDTFSFVLTNTVGVTEATMGLNGAFLFDVQTTNHIHGVTVPANVGGWSNYVRT